MNEGRKERLTRKGRSLKLDLEVRDLAGPHFIVVPQSQAVVIASRTSGPGTNRAVASDPFYSRPKPCAASASRANGLK